MREEVSGCRGCDWRRGVEDLSIGMLAQPLDSLTEARIDEDLRGGESAAGVMTLSRRHVRREGELGWERWRRVGAVGSDN